MGYQASTEEWSRSYIAKGVLGCFGGLIIHCVIGSFYQWGMINIYVTSYYKTIDPAVTLQSNAIAFPLMMFCYGLTFRVGIYLTEIIHPTIVMCVLTVLFSATVFVASYMNAIWGFLGLFGILFGLIIGMAFMIPVNQCNKYFPGMKLYVNGIILAGTGLGPVIFGQFSYNFINPHGLKPVNGYYSGDPELEALVKNVPEMIRYLSLFYLCFGFVSTMMMTPVFLHNRKVENEKKEKERLQNEQKIKNGIKIQEKVQAHRPNEANTIKQVLTSWVCWRQFIIILLLATGLYLMNGNYKTYVKKDINDDKFLTLVGVVGSVVNGVSRFFWSLFFLKTGYKTVVLSIVGISIIVFASLRFTVQTKGAYLFLIMLVNLGVGGIQVSTPSLVQYMFGQRMGENVYGLFWCTVSTANFIQFFLVSELGKVLAFNNLIYIGLGMSVCVIPIILLSTFQGPWKNPTQQLQYCITCRGPPVENNKVIDQTADNVQVADTKLEFDNSPVKNTDVSLSTKKALPRRLDPINEHDHFQISLKKSPTKNEMQNSSYPLQMQGSDGKNDNNAPISFISLDGLQQSDKQNLQKSDN